MFIERITLTNFRCFGPQGTTIPLRETLTAFVGVNGTGKTAVMQSLQRLFGVTSEQRRVRRRDFHVPANERLAIGQKNLSIEAVIAFPELDNGTDTRAVPEFFQHMAADEHGRLKCRLLLRATWTDDGTTEGTVDEDYWAIRTFGEFEQDDCVALKSADRSRIQLIYVPATRDGASQVAAFLKGRLWKAIQWSDQVKEALSLAGQSVNNAFAREPAVASIADTVRNRWQELHTAGTDTTPKFRPVDTRWQEFIGRVEVVFDPSEDGRERDLNELSDGQRSLFHLAMTAATLDVEAHVAQNRAGPGFLPDGVPLPALTLIAVEEPENTLAPFYLSRILGQIERLTLTNQAQAVISSHSASILGRVQPEAVRHFRLNQDRTAIVRSVRLPANEEEASKYVREAVRSYPELYFARFVLLGEGATEEVVLPRLAQALGTPVDRSFVAIAPLGGRHVNHLWKLLSDLDIPHATLLDLDWGRSGGGWGRIKSACAQLLAVGVDPARLFGDNLDAAGPQANLNAFDTFAQSDQTNMQSWLSYLRQFDVFFSAPLDLDHAMLMAYPEVYSTMEGAMRGPSAGGNPRDAVLGADGQHHLYGSDHDDALRWYRYLFLGRGKPSTHVRALSSLNDEQLRDNMPEPLAALITHMQQAIGDDGHGLV